MTRDVRQKVTSPHPDRGTKRDEVLGGQDRAAHADVDTGKSLAARRWLVTTARTSTVHRFHWHANPETEHEQSASGYGTTVRVREVARDGFPQPSISSRPRRDLSFILTERSENASLFLETS